MSKKKSKPMVIKQLSDLPAVWAPPMGTPQNPHNHPINNISKAPFGEQVMSITQGTEAEGVVGNSRGGGTTGDLH